MIRILHVVGSLNVGGAETMIINLYKNIDRTQIQFDFLVYNKEESIYTKIVRQLGGRIFFIDKAKIHNPIAYYLAMKNIIKQNGTFKAIHVHMDSHSFLPISIARLLKIKIRVCHSHTTRRNLIKGLIPKIYTYISGKIILLNSTNRLACGADAGKALYGNEDYEIFLNPISVDDVMRSSNDDVKSFLCKNKVRQECFKIGMIGRFCDVKNHKFAVDIIDELVKYDKNAVLIFAGDGPLRQSIEQLVERKGLSSYVRFLGVYNDMPTLLHSVDVLLMPSLYEGFPVTLIESQASGVPAVVSDSVTKEADLGLNLLEFFSLKRNASAWAMKLASYKNGTSMEIDDDVRKSVLCQKGFSMEACVNKIKQIYES